MLRGKKAVIFDMDGSLVDSMWIWPEVDRIYMDKYGLTEPETFHKDIEGMSYTETAQYFVDTFDTLNRTVEQVKEEWRDMTIELYATKVFPKPGAMEFLDRMKKQGILLGIATSNNREIADAALNARGLTEYFDSVRTSCEVAAGKPAPDVYLKVAEDLHHSAVNIGQLLYGDSCIQRFRNLHNRAFSHTIGDHIRPGIKEHRSFEPVRPVIIVRHPPKTGLDASQDNRCLFISLPDQIAVHSTGVIRPFPHLASRRVDVSPPPLL